MSADSPATEARRRRIEALRRRLDTLRERYGRIPVDLRAADRLEEQLARRVSRIDFLTATIAEHQAEIDLISKEIGGYLAGVEALLGDAIEQIQRVKGEAWSPQPVLGYRMWNIVQGSVSGVVEPWRTRTKVARCLNGRPGEDLPHSNGVCGPPACGIYATKDPGVIWDQMPRERDWAIGIVEMSGKVVEHSRGYRAQRAEMVALAIVAAGRRIHLDGQAEIDDALTNPVSWALRGSPAGSDTHEFAAASLFLAQVIERRSSWTSENKSA